MSNMLICMLLLLALTTISSANVNGKCIKRDNHYYKIIDLNSNATNHNLELIKIYNMFTFRQ